MKFRIPGQQRPLLCGLGWHRFGPRQWDRSRRRYKQRCQREECNALLTWSLERY